MEHMHTDMVVRGSKTMEELKDVLIDTGATYTVLPEEVMERVGELMKFPNDVDIELGNGNRIKARAYGVGIKIKDVEAPAMVITFKGAKAVVGVQTLESIGLKLDSTTGKLEFTRPKGIAYFY